MRVLQLIDSLELGGAERMAVNYANGLSGKIEFSGLCSSREEGPLKELLSEKVSYLFLNRKGRVDFKALLRLRNFIKKNRIEIIQAHGSSFFIGALIKISTPGLKMIWHDHYGQSEFLAARKARFLKIFSRYFDAVFAVNEGLANWSQHTLGVKKVAYLKNFIAEAFSLDTSFKVKGIAGKRIVCVANFRPQKNHDLLLDAFEELLKWDDELTLHLFGSKVETDYANIVLKRIRSESLKDSIFYYGTHLKMSAVLPHFNIGVLTSNSEGLPLALLEYGQAGLAVVVTDVGQCRELLGDCGKLIESGNKKLLIEAFKDYLKNPDKQSKSALSFLNKVRSEYSNEETLNQALAIYDQII